jgi:hypothetical protein
MTASLSLRTTRRDRARAALTNPLSEAYETAFASAHAEGFRAGALAERQRVAIILRLPEAIGLGETARALALSSAVSVEQARVMLGKLQTKATARKREGLIQRIVTAGKEARHG